MFKGILSGDFNNGKVPCLTIINKEVDGEKNRGIDINIGLETLKEMRHFYCVVSTNKYNESEREKLNLFPHYEDAWKYVFGLDAAKYLYDVETCSVFQKRPNWTLLKERTSQVYNKLLQIGVTVSMKEVGSGSNSLQIPDMETMEFKTTLGDIIKWDNYQNRETVERGFDVEIVPIQVVLPLKDGEIYKYAGEIKLF